MDSWIPVYGRWIWIPEADEAVDCYGLFRGYFELITLPSHASLRITASQSYLLWINGHWVKRGPVPSDPRWQHFDEIDVLPFLKIGKNLLAVLVHNHGVSTHDLPISRGGLLCELVTDHIKVGSNGLWRAKWSTRYARCAPRRFWSAGFAEIADLRQDEGWEQVNYDDTSWPFAVELGKHPVWPWVHLIPRPIPEFLTEERHPCTAWIGSCEISGVQVISFDPILQLGQVGIVYASCWMRLPQGELTLRIDCDDALVVFLDDKRILDQQMDAFWVRTRNWLGRDRWDQVHDGMHGRFCAATVKLNGDGSRHKLTIAVDHGPRGWGFVLSGYYEDITKYQRVPLECRIDCNDEAPQGWKLYGPITSNGFADALEQIAPSLDVPSITVLGNDWIRVTDMAILLQCESRKNMRPIDSWDSLELYSNSVIILDLGRVELGFPEFEFEGCEDGTVLDIGWSNLLPADYSVCYPMGNYMKYADRVYLRGGSHIWMSVLRRSFRYAHLSCRQGNAKVRRFVMHRWYCPTFPAAKFECSDSLLNRIYQESLHAVRLLMQERWQDCLRREMGTSNTQSFNYASIGAFLAFGATEVTCHTLRTIIRTQERSGWFDSHGLSGLNQDESTQCLYYHRWVRDWWRYTGNQSIVCELYPHLVENLEFFLKRCRSDGLFDQGQQHILRVGDIAYLIDELNCLRGYTSSEYGNRDLPKLLFGPNILASHAAECIAELAPVAGFSRHAPRWLNIAQRIRKAANNLFWDKRQGRYAASMLPDGRLVDHHPLMDLYALRFGLVSEDRLQQIIKILLNELRPQRVLTNEWPCYVFGSYHHLFEVFFEFGYHREAIELIKILFGTWLDCGGTAVPEYGRPYDIISGKIRDDIEVHAYGLGVLPLFYTRILGIQPVEPGFKHIRIAPCPGYLEWAYGDVYTPYGYIQVQWHMEKDTVIYQIKLPADIKIESFPPPGFKLILLPTYPGI